MSVISHERGYTIPERDCFIWLLDRDPYDGDLLTVCIDDEGSILPPLIIFDSARWKKRSFKHVIKEEPARRPDGILADFRIRRDGSSYIKSYVASFSGFHEPHTQFCAIIPLDPDAYDQQRKISKAGDVFERFESLLRLP
jgi:hypothetical protein